MEHQDRKLRELMKMAEVDMPFSDFEARVMDKIHAMDEQRRSVLLYKKKALIFFLLGTIFGFISNFFIMQILSEMDMTATLQNSLQFGSQMFYVLLIVLFSDSVLKLRKLRREG